MRALFKAGSGIKGSQNSLDCSEPRGEMCLSVADHFVLAIRTHPTVVASRASAGSIGFITEPRPAPCWYGTSPTCRKTACRSCTAAQQLVAAQNPRMEQGSMLHLRGRYCARELQRSKVHDHRDLVADRKIEETARFVRLRLHCRTCTSRRICKTVQHVRTPGHTRPA